MVELDDDFKKEITQFEKSQELIEKKKKVYTKKKQYTSIDKFSFKTRNQLFEFDPNIVTQVELEKLGFTKRQIQIFLRYREKGGRFYKKEDLLKIYGIKENHYNHLEAFVHIKKESSPKRKEYKNLVFEVEINSATMKELIKLKGIGRSYAKKIIKYRELLGGYVKKQQLLEVYGMDSSRYNQFCQFVKIDTSLVQHININKAEFKKILRHPYLDSYQCQCIMDYRELMGEFTDLKQILENNLIDTITYNKISPYCKITD
ncbi:MAG: helix-hairpin-helix domain-containing protein [Bacteroidales bacterium]|nr:helix-hairpin-helix domain-containing protein [Bacteroidales bacterium]